MRMRSGASVDPIDRADPRWKLNLSQGSISAATWWSPPARTPSRPCPPGQGWPASPVRSSTQGSPGAPKGWPAGTFSSSARGIPAPTAAPPCPQRCGQAVAVGAFNMNIIALRLAGIPLHPFSLAGRHLPRPSRTPTCVWWNGLPSGTCPGTVTRVLSSAPSPGWLRKGSWRPSTAGSSRRRKPDGHGEARR